MKEKVFSDWYHQTRDITARAGFDAAWQHQQAKVEKLQKRVDAALAVLTEYYTGSYDESPDLVVDIEQALKGEDSE
ncbi:hypothetical protein [Acinetobacter baumannii]|uniref:hypothetical protein n=1 Tax=Acinetobacter baumannii TaxID=470 RepID=UPI00061EF3B5|nr:hypothetical protein [Acinetobacter baumannii]AYY89941.1 hypothetical protein EGM95_14640 [Acinetobacter baumannii]KJX74331.1 hypothetical protein WH42_00545 [Acinetobacter baumannii]KQK32726.1 hypothetical protein AQ483_18975 [Acinetobacter baumannii]KQK39881.1 hypothetical protein AQ485_18615 [Acinetobacter baumannii]MBF6685713.1 hypothetical protein [Acinetobacter baumannii]